MKGGRQVLCVLWLLLPWLYGAQDPAAFASELEQASAWLAEARAAEAAADPELARERVVGAIGALLDETADVVRDGGDLGTAADGLLWDLGLAARRLGAMDASRRAWEWVVEHRARVLPVEATERHRARGAVALLMRETGDPHGALELQEKVLAAILAHHDPGHPEVHRARHNLAGSLMELGRLDEALVVQDDVVRELEQVLDESDPTLLRSRGNLAKMLLELGHVERAKEILERNNELFESALPPNHPDVLTARAHLADALLPTDPGAAATLYEEAQSGLARIVGPDHPRVLTVRRNLAVAMSKLGRLGRARELYEEVLAIYEQRLPADHSDLISLRHNLAGTLSELGDWTGFLALQRQVVAAFERTMPADNARLQSARAALAVGLIHVGDEEGARHLCRKALASLATTSHEGPAMQYARATLADVWLRLGEGEAALAELERVREAWSEGRPDSLEASLLRSAIAAVLGSVGRNEEARELFETALEELAGRLPPEHPQLFSTRSGLALTLRHAGRATEALEAQRSLWEDACAALPPGDNWRRSPLRQRIEALLEGGDEEGARGEGLLLLAELEAATERLFELSPRGTTERVRLLARDLAPVMALAKSDDHARIFALVETWRAQAANPVRVLGSPTGAASRDSVERLRELEEQVRALGRRVNDLVASAGGVGDGGTVGSVAATVLERDRLAAELRAGRAATSSPPPRVDLKRVADSLETDQAAVGVVLSQRGADASSMAETFLAYVVRSDGELQRVSLGEATGVRGLITAWRAAIGRPVNVQARNLAAADRPTTQPGTRGLSAPRSDTNQEEVERLGQLLAELLIGPILAAADGASELLVCVDDALHLVPLSALPWGGGLVGDHVSIRYRVSLAPLETRLAGSSAAQLLSIGGVDFGQATPATEGAGRALRSFNPLPESGAEALFVADRFGELFGRKAVVLSGAKATREAFHGQAPSARFLHLATHGYFAGGSAEGDTSGRASLGNGDFAALSSLRRLAPKSLCGLAFAGANGGPDSLGRTTGIVTGEELAVLDLRACELAVLSACDTSAGVQAGGMGLHSLRSALHAAGVRTTLTSLWSIDDRWARALMEAFYRRTWEDGLDPAEALWSAQVELQRAGAQPADWAGWVLSEG